MTGRGTGTVVSAPHEPTAAVPCFYRVASRREDTGDTVTVELTEPDGPVRLPPSRPSRPGSSPC